MDSANHQKNELQKEIDLLLAKKRYLSRRSDAFYVLHRWYQRFIHMDGTEAVDSDWFSAEQSAFDLATEVLSHLGPPLKRFTLSFLKLRRDLYSKLAQLSDKLNGNHDEVINMFNMSMENFALAVMDIAAKALEEWNEIIKKFQSEHRRHPECKKALALILVQPPIHRQIYYIMDKVVDEHAIVWLEISEELNLPEKVKDVMRDSVKRFESEEVDLWSITEDSTSGFSSISFLPDDLELEENSEVF